MSIILSALPEDVLYDVLAYLDPIDIVRTSKDFQRLTTERAVWAAAYKHSALLHPPGPFPYQNKQALEELLTRAAVLDRNWAGPRKPITIREIPPRPSLTTFEHIQLVMGRYLMQLDRAGLRCFDARPGGSFSPSKAIASYKLPASLTGSNRRGFRTAVWINSKNGAQTAFAVFVTRITSDSHLITILTLELNNSEHGFQLFDQLDTGRVRAPSNVEIRCDYLIIPTDDTAFLYHIPSKNKHIIPLLDNTLSDGTVAHSAYFHLTQTHLIALQLGRRTSLAAFELPSNPSTPSTTPLIQTHEGESHLYMWEPIRIEDTPSSSLKLLAVTGSTMGLDPATSKFILSRVYLSNTAVPGQQYKTATLTEIRTLHEPPTGPWAPYSICLTSARGKGRGIFRDGLVHDQCIRGLDVVFDDHSPPTIIVKDVFLSSEDLFGTVDVLFDGFTGTLLTQSERVCVYNFA